MPIRDRDAVASEPDIDEKKRARRRLLGAIVLAGAAAVVLPLVLDSEPRRPVQELQVEIQPREPRAGVTAPDPKDAPDVSAAQTPGADAPAAPTHSQGPAPVDEKPAAVEAKPAPAEAKPARAETKPARVETKPARVETKPAPSAPPTLSSESKRAPAETKPAANTGSPAPAYAVQIGAFANATGAAEQVARARNAGLKAYTERIRTPQGERIRVRVGPYPSREAAEQARTRLKAKGIESAIIAP